MSAWLVAGITLCGCLLVCAAACLRTGAAEAVVALQVAGTVAGLALIVLSVYLQREAFADLGLVVTVLSWAGTLAFVRYLERRP
jgi:multisubunit Na+/H+ antiporter MnhF subunit